VNVDQAREVLEAHQVPKNWYSFEPVLDDEDRSIVTQNGNYWFVYGLSRGTVVGRRPFESESDACLDFVESLVLAEEESRSRGAVHVEHRVYNSQYTGSL
jgi:hypothetical protein